MLQPRTTGAIAHLTNSVLAVKPLVAGMAVAVRVIPVARDATGTGNGNGSAARWSAAPWDDATGLLDRVASRTGVTGLNPVRDATPKDVDVFERVISTRLALAELAAELADVPVPADLLAEVDRVAAETVADGFDAVFGKETITARDGVPLNVYGAGPRGGEAVVLVPACGMPAALTESWMRFLARDRHVMTWESRGLFGANGHCGDYAVELDVQAEDLVTVLDHYGVSRAHVIGLCGGVMIALAAAAEHPDRIASLSLWHGAYAFPDGCPRTQHQHDLIELMAFAAHSRAAARSVQGTLCRMALTGTPADLAPFVLYPFASAELFYRYCRLNGSLTSTDVRQYLSRVTQPTLVVTSRDDVTAHPQGSRQVADGLPNARLRIEPTGDHISLFRADNALMRVAEDFIADCPRFL